LSVAGDINSAVGWLIAISANIVSKKANIYEKAYGCEANN